MKVTGGEGQGKMKGMEWLGYRRVVRVARVGARIPQTQTSFRLQSQFLFHSIRRIFGREQYSELRPQFLGGIYDMCCSCRYPNIGSDDQTLRLEIDSQLKLLDSHFSLISSRKRTSFKTGRNLKPVICLRVIFILALKVKISSLATMHTT